MVDAVLLAELVHRLQHLLIRLNLVPVHVDALDVLAELDRPVDLNLLVRCRAARGYLLGLRCVKSCLQLSIVHLRQDLEAVLEGRYG